MKTTILVLGAMLSFATLASAGEERPKFTPEQRKQLIDMNRRVFGGFVTKPDPGNGHIAVVNLQSRVSEKDIRRSIRYITRMSSLPIEIKTTPDPQAAISIYIKEEPKRSSSLIVSPGEFWSQVNISALAADKPSDTVLALRVRKELARGVAYACGGGGSQYNGTLAGPIRSLRELDHFSDEGLPPDSFMRMVVFAKAIGIRPVHRVSYAAAVQEGWAPAPTNEYQKVIWDKVHTPPQTPMKIEFDPKKGR